MRMFLSQEGQILKACPGDKTKQGEDCFAGIDYELFLLSFDHATSDSPTAIASRVSHLIVGIRMDDDRAAVGIKEGTRPRRQGDKIGGGVQMADASLIHDQVG